MSVQNVLNIWPNLRLGVLINFVLTKKRVYSVSEVPQSVSKVITSVSKLPCFLSFLAKICYWKLAKKCIISKKGEFEPQYFTLRTIKKLGDLSVKNVLNIWPNLRLGVLINFVLIKKSALNLKIFLLHKKCMQQV